MSVSVQRVGAGRIGVSFCPQHRLAGPLNGVTPIVPPRIADPYRHRAGNEPAARAHARRRGESCW